MQKNHNRQAINTIFCYALAICLLISFPLIAQKKERLSYFDMKVLEKADDYFETEDYYNALVNYRKINKKDHGDTTVIFRIAECLKLLNSFEESEQWYGSILNNDNKEISIDNRHKLNFAQVLTINGKYDEALYWYKEYYFYNTSDPRGKAGIRTIENLNKLYYDTMFYVAYPSNINTIYTEFSPVFYNNGVVFISDRPKAKVSKSDKGNRPGYLNWYFANLNENSKLGDPVQFNRKKNIETYFNEGPVVFYDNDKKMIFSQNALVKGKTKDKVIVIPVWLYSAFKNDQDQWSEIKQLDFCNGDYSFTQPTISSDGKTLIFSSKMPDGFGGSDLYMSKFENNTWQEPVNLGERINSKGDEMFPYLLNDSILYFSSDGHGGLGGLDICFIPLNDTGQIENIGFPVNSPGNDFGIIYDEDGMSGYFSSNRESSNGKEDIYVFKIIRVSLTIKIIDIKTSHPISDAEVFSISGIEENPIGKTDENGFCTVIIPVSKEIKIRVKKEDFESHIFTFEPMRYKTENIVVLPIDDTKNLAERLPEKENTKVVYKVQIMASRQQASPREIKRKYKGNLPVTMSYEDRWYKYIIGEFDTYFEACECLNACKVYDAFIAAYINDVRVKIVIGKSSSIEKINCYPEKNTK